MADERFAEHLEQPAGQGLRGTGHRGAAGGAACGDLVSVELELDGAGRVAGARFEASGCGALTAAASAAITLVEGRDAWAAARVGAEAIAAELGGLSPGKRHAADLVSDALHYALGRAVRAAAPREEVPGRVLVAMSGGVDSAVAALLCARESAHVGAVTLELWRDADNDAERSCCSASAVRAARALAHRLGLPHLTLDLRDEFRAGVVEPWLADHAAGLTPNPCVRCNGHVRLDAMLDAAARLGAGALATGHYARVGADGLLRLATDAAKDQTYMLAALSPDSLARLRFPLAGLTKPQVRALAAEHDLPVARKPDSQDLCFLAGTGKRAFLARHGGPADRPGAIVDRAGRRLGAHRGQHHFTIGQRRGLPGGAGTPLYVLAKQGDTVVAGPREALATTAVALEDVVLHRPAAEVDAARLRSHGALLGCRLEGETLVLDEPAPRPAPGQVACLLRGDAVVGHAKVAAPGAL